MRISSRRVRDSSTVLTLTRRGCDCTSLVGRRGNRPVDGEISLRDVRDDDLLTIDYPRGW